MVTSLGETEVEMKKRILILINVHYMVIVCTSNMVHENILNVLILARDDIVSEPDIEFILLLH